MANSQIEKQEVENLKCVERRFLIIDDRSSTNRMIESGDMQTKLLHHLIDVSKVVTKRPSDRESEELLKANNALVNELLNVSAVEKVNVLETGQEPSWKEILLQKLAGIKVDPDHKKMKTVVQTVDELVAITSSLERSECKVTLVIDTKKNNHQRQMVYLRGVTYSISLSHSNAIWPKSNDIWSNSIYSEDEVSLYVNAQDFPQNMTCEIEIKAKIKNYAGKRDWTRSFSKVFNKPAKNGRCFAFSAKRLIERDEFDDESQGLMKDGKIEFEIKLQAAELVEIKKPLDQKQPLNNKQSLDQKQTQTETN